ncbi:aminotransferase class V-fold PLP-dependent enzyme [Aeoliella mucimassa]|uniref:Putative cysteine desulfurase n=1 Tax=Aeoliella mucimassa TaxID=2527972 RepID=A0A518AM81_9BACT|nr:aminotransferase class V-fold PLP-dependent enzyme [Aeoliella mucimassa]QDU55835.1 putative cysteine desulfurase [Aeoliella mucimassa]
MTTEPTTTNDPLALLCEAMEPSRQMAYFDHAALSPLPRQTAQTIVDYANKSTQVGNVHWLEWLNQAEEARDAAAEMIGASRDEITFTPSTTYGINLVSEGLDWREGDNLVTLEDEFPTNLYPWMHLESRGVECRRIVSDNGIIDYDALAEACDSRTRLISVSWVGYRTGYRIDLAKMSQFCRERSILFNLDAIQALGVFPIDVSKVHIDFLATGGQKWLLGPEGIGFAYIKQEHIEKLRPINVGWNSVANPFDYGHIELDFKPNAARFAGGGWNMCGTMAMGQSLKLLNQVGAEAMSERVLDYTDLACERLASAGAVITNNRDKQHRNGEHRSGIVYFELPGRDPVKVREQCIERNIVLSCRAGKLRISPHAYNTTEDLDRLIEAISDAQ